MGASRPGFRTITTIIDTWRGPASPFLENSRPFTAREPPRGQFRLGGFRAVRQGTCISCVRECVLDRWLNSHSPASRVAQRDGVTVSTNVWTGVQQAAGSPSWRGLSFAWAAWDPSGARLTRSTHTHQ